MQLLEGVKLQIKIMDTSNALLMFVNIDSSEYEASKGIKHSIIIDKIFFYQFLAQLLLHKIFNMMKQFKFIVMRKILYFLFALLIITSCEGPMGPPGPQGDDAIANWKIIDIDIPKWELDETGTFFYAHISVPELTDFIYTDGVVMAYHETVSNNGNYKTPLPYTRYNQETDGYLWSELLDFTFNPGWVTFYSNPSDFFTGIKPDPVYLTLALIWP